MHTYEDMVRRIDATPELSDYQYTILCDWPNWDEHIEWICTAPVAEIVDWASTVEAASIAAGEIA